MDEKLKKLLEKLYEIQDENEGSLSDRDEGIKDILNVILYKDEDALDELMGDYDV